jgi:hypothetical protein
VQLLENPQPLMVVVYLPEEPDLVKACYEAVMTLLKEADKQKENAVRDQQRNHKNRKKES